MKIRSKLIISFLSMAMIVAFSNLLSVFLSQTALEENIGENSILLTAELMNEIDQYLYNKIQEFEIFSKRPIIQDALLSSNTDFEKLNNIEEFIEQKDKEWISQTDKPLPFMNDIIYNTLSDQLRQKIAFYEDVYGGPVIGEIFITNAYGANVAQSGLTTDYKQDDETWWQMAKKEGLYVQDLEYDESAGVYSVDLGIRLDDENENFLGVMKVVLNIEDIINIIKNSQQSSKFQYVEYSLIDGKGKVVYSTEQFETFDDLSNNSSFQSLVGDSGYFVSNNFSENDDQYHHYAYVVSNGYKDFEGLGWTLILGYNSDEVLAPSFLLRDTLLLVVIFSLILALFLGFFVSNKISKPIAVLKDGAEKIAEGHFDTTITPSGGAEIKVLCESFNRMSKKIKNQMNELKGYDKIKELNQLKDEFASMVTHELKTPLTPIQGYCEMLKDSELFGKLNSEQLNAVKEIEDNSKQLERLISDVLDAQKIDMVKMKFNKKQFQVEEFMAGIHETYLPLMKAKKIQFVNTTKTELTLTSDPNRLEQVLSNLIKNAVDFVPEGGRIEIGAKNENSKIIFYVKDNGVGIPKENQKHLFKKFYQIDTSLTRKHGGTGLGLSICKGIVDGLGGKIWIESESGKGTNFYFTIPIEVQMRIEV